MKKRNNPQGSGGGAFLDPSTETEVFFFSCTYFNLYPQFAFKDAIVILAITLSRAVCAGGGKTRRTSAPSRIRHEWAYFKIIKERPRTVTTMIMLLLPAPSQAQLYTGLSMCEIWYDLYNCIS